MTMDEAKERARARWGRVTAFRLGVVLGEAGSGLLPPYEAKSAIRQYRCGYEWGVQQAAKVKP